MHYWFCICLKNIFYSLSADYNCQFNPIPEPHPDNKVLHSFYKIHIVHDHEQIQSEMTDHNKDKPFLVALYQYSYDLIGLMSKLPTKKLPILCDLANSPLTTLRFDKNYCPTFLLIESEIVYLY